MFVSEAVPVEAGFEVARARLGKLGGWLLGASSDAYSEQVTGLHRVGPLGPVPGLSRLAEIRLRALSEGSGQTGLALRWEVRGPGGRLFPVLDADLTLTPAGQHASTLRLDGTYRPPGGDLGARLDRAILHRVASATVRNFLGHVADAIAGSPVGVARLEREHRAREGRSIGTKVPTAGDP